MFSISVLSPQAFASHDLLAMISPGSFDSFLIRFSGTNRSSFNGYFGACLDGTRFLAGLAFDMLFEIEKFPDFKEICLHFSRFFCILSTETLQFCKVLSSHFVKGKPAARRGRKVMGLLLCRPPDCRRNYSCGSFCFQVKGGEPFPISVDRFLCL